MESWYIWLTNWWYNKLGLFKGELSIGFWDKHCEKLIVVYLVFPRVTCPSNLQQKSS